MQLHIDSRWNIKGFGSACLGQLIVGAVGQIMLLVANKHDTMLYAMVAFMMGLGVFGTVLASVTREDHTIALYGLILAIIMALFTVGISVMLYLFT